MLLTGFDPFGGHATNASQEIIERLAWWEIDYAQLRGLVLPTTYDGAFAEMRRALEQFQPEGVLMLGMAAGSTSLRIETGAANRVSTELADNAGVTPESALIAPAAPAELQATVDAPRLQRDLDGKGVPASLSHDCGAFVCNHLYFSTLHYLHSQGLPSQAVFVHVPAITSARESDAFEKEAAALARDAELLLAAFALQLV